VKPASSSTWFPGRSSVFLGLALVGLLLTLTACVLSLGSGDIENTVDVKKTKKTHVDGSSNRVSGAELNLSP
jgi:hypothetical protein